jgi:hypothetical protein
MEKVGINISWPFGIYIIPIWYSWCIWCFLVYFPQCWYTVKNLALLFEGKKLAVATGAVCFVFYVCIYVYIWYIFPVLVYCAKKYLATLLEGKKNKMGGRRLFCVSYITFVEAKKLEAVQESIYSVDCFCL